MNIEELKKSSLIIFECVSGSVAYNLNNEKSDIDIRGIFKLPKSCFLSIIHPPQEIKNNKEDIKYYELKKFFDLAKDCNPNIIELLFMSQECIHICNYTMKRLIENKSLFVSQKAYHTFSGYAHAQIEKAKGQNKLVHNPKPKDPPKKEEFCWIVPFTDSEIFSHNFGGINFSAMELSYEFPGRPIPLKDVGIDLKNYHVSSLEHSPNVYRIYNYSDNSKGVFRGNDMLVCESIPKEDEKTRFAGFLIYNQHEFEKALKTWKNYWDWVKNRNENRWLDQENKKVDFDSKNMMHCMRLLYSGKNILISGEPIIRFEGKQREYLMDIRKGRYSYEEIMEVVQKEMKELEAVKDNSKIQWGSDINKIDKLYKELMEMQNV